jgi:tRNA(Arg) A34 adenosine deaminase TadA
MESHAADAQVPEDVWRECFELAWTAWRSGSSPVGAVVLDGDGTIVATGRNRIREAGAGPPGQLAGTRIAHAEVNALAQLRAGRRYRDHTLVTAVEPCHLCMGAAYISTIGAVHYAAADSWGGAARTHGSTASSQHWSIVIKGPRNDKWGSLFGALPLASALRSVPDAPMLTMAASKSPELLALAQLLVTADVETLDEAVALAG